MTTENYLIVIGAGILSFLVISTFFIYPFIVGKIKKVDHPYQFAFASGSVTLGVQALIAIVSIPFFVFIVFAYPGYSKDNPNSYVIDLVSYIRDIIHYIELSVIVLTLLIVPFILLKKVWPSYEAGIKANQQINRTENTSVQN